MRAFLGVTWIYAGWDKASDAGFLIEGAPTYIGSALSAYSTNSPISFLLKPILEYSEAVGIFIMVCEFAVGLATLLWIAPQLAALGGFVISIGLWLSSTFYITPYFLASNSAYAILWLTYFLLIRSTRRNVAIRLDRRGFLRISLVAIGAVAASLAGKFLTSESKTAAQSALLATPKKIIKVNNFAVGQTYNFSTANGTPAVLFRTEVGVFAYSAVCTHEGCTVIYSQTSDNLQCPCHGALFDPKSQGKAISGPTNTPLERIRVAIQGAWVVQT